MDTLASNVFVGVSKAPTTSALETANTTNYGPDGSCARIVREAVGTLASCVFVAVSKTPTTSVVEEANTTMVQTAAAPAS